MIRYCWIALSVIVTTASTVMAQTWPAPSRYASAGQSYPLHETSAGNPHPSRYSDANAAATARPLTRRFPPINRQPQAPAVARLPQPRVSTPPTIPAPTSSFPAAPSRLPVVIADASVATDRVTTESNDIQSALTEELEQLAVETTAPGEHYLYPVDTARNGYFFQYDHLFWSLTPPDTRVIGDPGSEGNYVYDGVTAFRVNSLDSGFIDYDTDSADRIEFGWNENEHGWLVGGIIGRNSQSMTASGVSFIPQDTSTIINQRLLAGWQDADEDGIDDDLDGDNIHGNDGLDLGTPDGMGGYMAPFDGIPDVAAPQDNDDLVIYLPLFDSFNTRYEVEMRGVEFMTSQRYAHGTGSHIEWLGGVRYLEIDDTFSFNGSGGVLDATNLSMATRNKIIGPQVGLRWVARYSSFMLNVEGRLMLGWNFQDVSQSGTIASNFEPGPNMPAALTPFSFNSSFRDEEFAPIGEWRVESGWAINQHTRIKVGYTGMVIDGFGRSLDRVSFSLPDFAPSQVGSSHTVVVTAITLGIELNR